MKPLLEVDEPVNNIQNYEPMGVYDDICMKDIMEDTKDNEYYSDYMVNMYTGVDVRQKDDLESYPSIDGTEDSPKKLSIFLNNMVKPECCTNSIYSTSSGCVCLTNDQKMNLYNRAGNK